MHAAVVQLIIIIKPNTTIPGLCHLFQNSQVSEPQTHKRFAVAPKDCLNPGRLESVHTASLARGIHVSPREGRQVSTSSAIALSSAHPPGENMAPMSLQQVRKNEV